MSSRLKKLRKKAEKRLRHKLNKRNNKLFTQSTHEERDWFLDPLRRPKLEELKVIRVYGGGHEAPLCVADIEGTYGKPLRAEWMTKVHPPVKIEELPLYVYRHLRRKHRGITNTPAVEDEFWDLIQPWLDDRGAADNIVGGLELEKELLPPWYPGMSPFAGIPTRKVVHTPMMVKVTEYAPLPLPEFSALDFLSKFEDFSYGVTRADKAGNDSGKLSPSSSPDDVSGAVPRDLRDRAGRPGTLDLEQDQGDATERSCVGNQVTHGDGKGSGKEPEAA